MELPPGNYTTALERQAKTPLAAVSPIITQLFAVSVTLHNPIQTASSLYFNKKTFSRLVSATFCGENVPESIRQ